ncbi:SUKH-3 domain-containing protein [Paenibacillus alvei]|uniref:SUKH-3 domain-containing protein n=1 Tax=Paenibacillus alvei TaxID=44250 RepID=UPI002282F2A2|nr:SUKH-3 domain-containing protein [Paenibacillus alvei]
MDNLSSETTEVLRQAGWNPSKMYDVTGTIEFLGKMGYKIFNSVPKILSEFGGIEYKFKHPDGSEETFHLIPEEAVGDYYEKEDFDEFEMRVKEPLIVIGEAYRGNLILFISESGKVYGKNGYSLFKFGDNIYEALDTICLFRKPVEIE